MQGVEILSTTTHYEIETLGWVWITYALICLATWIVAGLFWYWTYYDAGDAFAGGLLCTLLVGVVLLIPTVCLSTKSTDKIDYYKHKVTVDETVDMNEFLSKYEIVEQDGKLITVIENVE